VANQSSITGPNTAPMLAVPRLWTANRPIRIATVIGTTYGRNIGVATSSPSTALSTEIAGVIMLSPYRREAPKSPSSTSTQWRRRACSEAGVTSAVRAIIPPSPQLSARITKARYLIEMTRISAQKISDSSPSTLAAVGATPCTPCSDSRSA
jgi:hypothetical protein